MGEGWIHVTREELVKQFGESRVNQCKGHYMDALRAWNARVVKADSIAARRRSNLTPIPKWEESNK